MGLLPSRRSHWPQVVVSASKYMRKGPFHFFSYAHTYTYTTKLTERIISLLSFAPTKFSKPFGICCCVSSRIKLQAIREHGQLIWAEKLESQFSVLRFLPRYRYPALWFLLRASRKSGLLQVKWLLIHMMALNLVLSGALVLFCKLQDIRVLCHLVKAVMTWCSLPKAGRVGQVSETRPWAGAWVCDLGQVSLPLWASVYPSMKQRWGVWAD